MPGMNVRERRRENLKRLIDERYEGKTGRLADALGKKRPTIYRLFAESDGAGARDIGEDLAREIERVHRLPMHWMDVDHANEINSPASAYNVDPAPPPGSRLPHISWVAAGNRGEANDPFAPGAAFDWIDFDSMASKSAFCLQVRGTSMVRPDGTGFPDGCFIAVEPRRQPKSGDFVVVRFNDTDEATFKQYFVEGLTKYLRPLNPTYPTLMVTPDAQMVGVVIEKRVIEKF